jgi:ABC-type branched-subunit amino acid transport system substrate-binding protein
MSQYCVGGTLRANSSTYVEREADRELYQALNNGEYCYILSPRQTGKSSLMVRTIERLKTRGFACIAIDLTEIGMDISKEQWYVGVINRLVRQINVNEFDLDTWWNRHRLLSPMQRLNKFIEEQLLSWVPSNQKIIIFVDEINCVLSPSLKGKLDDFFALIRSCHNRRASKPEFNRITFVLLGVAIPSDLICDPNKTPFNIGKKIELNGFHLHEAEPLIQGLQGRVSDPQGVLQAVLDWTGGQPFLTQKILGLITNGMEASGVEQLVQQRIVQNWEFQDNPPHLRTIRERIVNSVSGPQSVTRLLGLYKQILQKGEINADDSVDEQQELLLSGLVVKQEGKLKVYNRIYQNIFHLEWVENQILNQRPYQQQITEWLANDENPSKLLRGKKLNEALLWSKGKTLSREDNVFITASLELERRRNRHNFSLTILGFLGAGCSIGIWSMWHIDQVEQTFLSEGERTLFKGIENSKRDRGIEAFKDEKYADAMNYFEDAIQANPTDPEVQIYANNATALLKNKESGNKEKDKLVTLAVVLPLDPKDEIAAEILRGVAQAQTSFNKKSKDRFLKIKIAKDDNAPDKAKTVARKLIEDQDIIGVIGHNTTKATESALDEYQKARIAIISPTSTGTSLKRQNIKTKTNVFFRFFRTVPNDEKPSVFFRTVPNDEKTAEKLASYAIENNYKQVGIANNPNSTYSESITQEFQTFFKDKNKGRSVVGDPINLSYSALDASGVVSKMYDNQVKAFVLLPDTETISVVNEIASAQQRLSQQGTKKLPLLGADALYNPKIFEAGDAVEGLVLAIPWFAEEPNSKKFAGEAEKRWKGRVSWRTAASYDATQAFIKALAVAQKPTRTKILETLQKRNFSQNESSGNPIRFSNGERQGQEPVLVKVVKSSDGLQFELVK